MEATYIVITCFVIGWIVFIVMYERKLDKEELKIKESIDAQAFKQVESQKNRLEDAIKCLKVPIAEIADLAIDIAGSIDHTPLERVLEIAQKNNDGEQAIDEFCMEYSGQIERGFKRLASKRSEKKGIKIDFNDPSIKAHLDQNTDRCLDYLRSIITSKLGHCSGGSDMGPEGKKILKTRNWE